MNGYKTVTGLIIFVLGMTELAQYISEEEVAIVVDKSIEIFGAVLFIVGIIHKAYKAYKGKF